MKNNFSYWYYYNYPLDIKPVKKWNEDLNKIITVKKNYIINPFQKIIIDTKNFILKIDLKEFPVCIWDNNFKWIYNVFEKIEFPYFKWKDFFHYPSYNNFLWKKLIILWNPETWKKIKQWIHSFPKTLWNFKQWHIKWNWCIRLDPKYEEEIFNIIKLWAKVIIK